MPPVTAIRPRALSATRRLAAWYRRHARELPWRRAPTPYHVLVSEVMLQQTTVETVIPYYERFVERFPNLRSLAVAREEDLLRLWSGLGYYRRARGLLAAAREIVRRHEGTIPDTREELLALPGIGPYTASAILALAHGKPEVALDGNLRRVLSRLAAYRGDPAGARGTRALTAHGRRLIGSADPAVINQALMDLGATICSPRAPRCLICPLSQDCRARASGMAERIPAPRPRAGTVAVRLAAAVVKRAGRVLLRRRSGPLMAGLWEFPMVEIARSSRKGQTVLAGAAAGGAATTALRSEMARFGIRPAVMTPAGRFSHTITKHRIAVDVFEVQAEGELRGGTMGRRGRVAGSPKPPAERVADPKLKGASGERRWSKQRGSDFAGSEGVTGRSTERVLGVQRRSDLAGSEGGTTRWVPEGAIAGMALGGISRKIAGLPGVRLRGSGRHASAR